MGILGPITGKLLDTIGLKPLALFGISEWPTEHGNLLN